MNISLPSNNVTFSLVNSSEFSLGSSEHLIALAQGGQVLSGLIGDSPIVTKLLANDGFKNKSSTEKFYLEAVGNVISISLYQLGEALPIEPAEIKSTAGDIASLAVKSGADKVSLDMSAMKLNDESLLRLVQTVSANIVEKANDLVVLKASEDKTNFLTAVEFLASDSQTAIVEAAVAKGIALGLGINVSRQLGDLPGNICTPSFLAERAQELAGGNVSVDVKGGAEIQALGMGAFWGVAKGSSEDAKLITIEYKGGVEGDAPIVFVGKGLTFDSGGISLKPGASMDEMKYDMCGAASVIGAMAALKALALPINVTAVIGSCENMPDAAALKPGDVVTSMAGKTIEILNTDAEGRLVLCDVLQYAKRFKPKVIIDLATLTGAIIIGLGRIPSGLFSNDDNLANQLLAAGEASQDKLWRMPIWEEYQQQLKSNFADLANIGGRDAGSITAACFLANFVRDEKWAHLDIAGTAWVSGGSSKGSTGRPVSLLVEFLQQQV